MAKQPEKKSEAKKPSESKQVATTQSAPSSLAAPDWMKQYAGQGTEGIDTSTLDVPRIALMHDNSPAVEEGLVEAGHYWHRSLALDLGEEVTVVPLRVEDGYVLWDPDKDNNRVLARGVRNQRGVWVWDPAETEFNVRIGGHDVKWNTAATIRDSGLADWGKNGVKPMANAVIDVLFVVPSLGLDVVGVYTFSRSAYGIGKSFKQQIMTKAAAFPVFALKFKLTAHTVTSKNGKKHLAPIIKAAGLVEGEEDFMNYKALYEKYKAVGLNLAAPEEATDSVGDDADHEKRF